MRKRLALLTVTALSVAGVLAGSVGASIKPVSPPNGGAPASPGCTNTDVTCRAP